MASPGTKTSSAGTAISCLDQYLSWIGLAKPPRWLQLFSYGDLYNYGAAFDMIAAALNRFSPLGVYETRHLLNASFGILRLVGCWKLGSAPRRARALASSPRCFLLLTPNYYGQMFNNPKDIPFAVGCRLGDLLPGPHRCRRCRARSRALVVKLGHRDRPGDGGADRRPACSSAISGSCWRCSAIWQVGDGGDALSAPAAVGWVEPVAGAACRRPRSPIAVMLAVLAVGAERADQPTRCRRWRCSRTRSFPYQARCSTAASFRPANLPWALSADLYRAGPAGADLGAAACRAGAGRRCAVARRLRPAARDLLGCFMLGFTIVFPVVYAIADQGGAVRRHAAFHLCAAADRRRRGAGRRSGADAGSPGLPYRRPIYAALGLYGMAHVIDRWCMLHPDQYVYYNAFIGGVDGAQRNFKLDYWANSYAEAVHGLENYLRKQYGADFEEREFTVAVCGPPVSAAYYFPANFRFVASAGSTRAFLHRLHQGQLPIAPCRAGRSTRSSGWERCCRSCSTGAPSSPPQRVAKRPLAHAAPHRRIAAYP